MVSSVYQATIEKFYALAHNRETIKIHADAVREGLIIARNLVPAK